MKSAANLPESHPVKQLFRSLTERGLNQGSLGDRDILLYLADLLIDFMFVENLYRMRDAEGRRLEYLVDLLEQAVETVMPAKKAYYKHIGDYSLFMLGMFPGYIARSRRAVSPSYYADTGRIGYQIAGHLESHRERTIES